MRWSLPSSENKVWWKHATYCKIIAGQWKRNILTFLNYYFYLSNFLSQLLLALHHDKLRVLFVVFQETQHWYTSRIFRRHSALQRRCSAAHDRKNVWNSHQQAVSKPLCNSYHDAIMPQIADVDKSSFMNMYRHLAIDHYSLIICRKPPLW